MKQLFNLRNLLILLIFILIGYVFFLKGCFGEKESPKTVPTKIKFYFKNNPNDQYLDSLKSYFNNSLKLEIIFREKKDTVNQIKQTEPGIFIPVQNRCLCIDRFGRCYSFCKTGDVVTRDPRQGITNIINLINLKNMPKNLRVNIAVFEFLTEVEPNQYN